MNAPSLSPVNHWIFQAFPSTAENLAVCRILYAMFVLTMRATNSYGFAASLPSFFFLPPPGPMQLVPGVPGASFFTLLHILIIVGAVLLLFGYQTRWVSILLTLLFLTGYGYVFSLGKINHNILPTLLPLVMAFSNWGSAYSLDARLHPSRVRNPETWPLAMMALMTGFAMFSAGLPKLLTGWLAFDSLAVQTHQIYFFVLGNRQELLAPFFMQLQAPVFWEMLDWATVVFEMGFLVAVFYPRAFRLFCGIAVLFHLAVVLMFNITFSNHLIVYALFVDWQRALPKSLFRLLEKGSAFVARHKWATLCIVLGLSAGIIQFGSPRRLFDALFPTGQIRASHLLLHFGSAVFVLWLGGRAVWQRFRG